MIRWGKSWASFSKTTAVSETAVLSNSAGGWPAGSSGEARSRIHRLGVPGQQCHPAEALQLRVSQHALGQPASETAPPMPRRDDHVRQVAVGGEIGDDPTEADGVGPRVDSETDRV